jgi:hypothetical protein
MVKLPSEEARKALIEVIGTKYSGEDYFDLVDRVYTRIEHGIIPVYDVRLDLTKERSLQQLLRMYSYLRDRDIKHKWRVFV